MFFLLRTHKLRIMSIQSLEDFGLYVMVDLQNGFCSCLSLVLSASDIPRTFFFNQSLTILSCDGPGWLPEGTMPDREITLITHAKAQHSERQKCLSFCLTQLVSLVPCQVGCQFSLRASWLQSAFCYSSVHLLQQKLWLSCSQMRTFPCLENLHKTII